MRGSYEIMVLGDHQLVHQLAELTAHGLPVLQPQVHADRLLLQHLDLAADGGQVALEAAQHALHALHREERRGTQRLVETRTPSAIHTVQSVSPSTAGYIQEQWMEYHTYIFMH